HFFSITSLFVMSLCFVPTLYDYHFINENKTWTEAQSFCRENYTDLATVYRRSDIKNLNQTGAWIGLNYCLSINGTWSWTQPGVEFNDNETEWSEGEPNDQNQPENCAFSKTCLSHKACLSLLSTEHENKTYVVEENKTWLEALKHCRDNMGDLATQEQARWNGSELQTGDHRWIGLFRDRWMWSDGSTVRYDNWRSDNVTDNCDMSAAMESQGAHKWVRKNYEEKFNFFCFK
uniref:C-type lectin domain-containing protein n=1 Tax=Echeneis naucrates TaxID=173247 RepID=A0A665VI64_ECHNA